MPLHWDRTHRGSLYQHVYSKTMSCEEVPNCLHRCGLSRLRCASELDYERAWGKVQELSYGSSSGLKLLYVALEVVGHRCTPAKGYTGHAVCTIGPSVSEGHRLNTPPP